MNCRHCGKILSHVFLDLGFAPPSNAYLSAEDLTRPEKYYPLKVMVCDNCWLVQTIDFTSVEELFSCDYSYFSSTSTSWLKHTAKFVKNIIPKLSLNQNSQVVEIASNDGYLLKNFVSAKIPCLGIEPTESTAAVAERLGIPVLRDFFSEKLGQRLVSQGKQADLIIGNNVYAHVPDINDFTAGLKTALKPKGTITLEFPHVLELIKHTQFDTVYHEHFSYLSLYVVNQIFRTAGLRVFDVEQLSTHGGSLRVYGCHEEDCRKTLSAVSDLIARENEFGLQSLDTYCGFQDCVDKIKLDLLTFLIDKKREGKKIIAYGAAAKGNTLLNYAGVKPDLLPFVCDAASAKQGKYLPGSHIPIYSPQKLMEYNSDFILVLPWNIVEEVKIALSDTRKRGSRLVTVIPTLDFS